MTLGPYKQTIRRNQIDKGRDLVTISLSADGVAWDRHWAVRYDGRGLPISQGGSCPNYKGAARPQCGAGLRGRRGEALARETPPGRRRPPEGAFEESR